VCQGEAAQARIRPRQHQRQSRPSAGRRQPKGGRAAATLPLSDRIGPPPGGGPVALSESSSPGTPVRVAPRLILPSQAIAECPSSESPRPGRDDRARTRETRGYDSEVLSPLDD
jgi:hypothetical protein